LLVKKQINFVQIFQIICPLSLIILFISLTLFPQQMDHWEAAGRFATYFIGPNEFGNAVMLITLMTIFSINSLGQDATALKLLKFTGIILGLYLEIKSQTRGAWILEPIMLVLWLSIHWKSKSAKELAAYGLITIIAALLAYFFVDFFHARVNSIYHEMRAWFNQTDINTSTGIRFTMWQICWALFKHSPWFGYSDLGYQTTLLLPEFQAQFSKQAIAVLNCCGPHNQMLADTLHSGIFGLFAALARTFIPLIVFVRGLKSTSIEARAASAIGLCYIIGLFFTGLSLESFSLKFMNSYYGLTLACLCASVLCKPAGNTVKVNN
jgi:O-antigen ligase